MLQATLFFYAVDKNMDIKKIKISKDIEKLTQKAKKNRLVHNWTKFVEEQLDFWATCTGEKCVKSLAEFLGKQILNDFGKEFSSILVKSMPKPQTSITKGENSFIIQEFNSILNNIKLENNEQLLKLAKTLDYFLHSLKQFKDKKSMEYIVYLRSLPSYIRLNFEINGLIKESINKNVEKIEYIVTELIRTYSNDIDTQYLGVLNRTQKEGSYLLEDLSNIPFSIRKRRIDTFVDINT